METIYTNRDTYIRQVAPDANYGSASTIKIGVDRIGEDPRGDYNGFFGFSLASLSNIAITAVSFIFNQNEWSGTGGTLYLSEYTASWGETTLTWNNASAIPASFKSLSIPEGTGLRTYDISEVVTAINAKIGQAITLACTCDAEYIGVAQGSARLALTTIKYANPVINVSKADRLETSAKVNFSVDAGYDAPQTNDQIRKVEYSINEGAWIEATLGTWDGLNNSFEIGSLTASSTFGLRVRVTNKAPEDTGLDDKVSAIYLLTIFEYTPHVFMFRNPTTGVSGIIVKGFGIEQADFSGKHLMLDLSGWIRCFEDIEYVSVVTARIKGDQREHICKCSRIRWKQGGGYKYNYVIADPTYDAGTDKTTITISTGYLVTTTDSLFAVGDITDFAYSCGNPVDFPDSFLWTPITAGFSSVTAINNPRFLIYNGLCMSYLSRILGTSNSTATTFTLPVTPAITRDLYCHVGVMDNGVMQTLPGHVLFGSGAAVKVAKSWYDNAWTSSGTKGIWLPEFSYKI